MGKAAVAEKEKSKSQTNVDSLPSPGVKNEKATSKSNATPQKADEPPAAEKKKKEEETPNAGGVKNEKETSKSGGGPVKADEPPAAEAKAEGKAKKVQNAQPLPGVER